MSCKSTCPVCGRKFDRYSGYLLNISDKCISELRSKVSFNKHVVVCSECIRNILGRSILVKDLKFKGDKWYTSNIAWLLRLRLESGKISESEFNEEMSKLKELDNKGISSYKM